VIRFEYNTIFGLVSWVIKEPVPKQKSKKRRTKANIGKNE
jgi:hypothetical protein